MDRLTQLEHRSVFLLREAYASFRNLGMLWSIGKDSTVLLWLCRKAFFGHVPFWLIHVDTSFKIPEMVRYRDELVRKWGLKLIVSRNDAALRAKRTFPDGVLDRISCCRELKTVPLQAVVGGRGDLYALTPECGELKRLERLEPFGALILGIRADEEGSRSKERYFSPRSGSNSWDIEDQPPEVWGYFNTDFPSETHVRVHPLLDWTELDVWEYIEREQIPTVSLYYDDGSGRRYRSLGCEACTAQICSHARSPEEILHELRDGKLAQSGERSGRAQDKEGSGGLEALRRDGYM